MGTALTGFLGGFLEAKTKFDELDQRKAQQQQALEVQKEELKLRQQALKGTEAHQLLQNRALEAKLAQELREQQGREALGKFFEQGGNLNDPQGFALAARYLPPAQLLDLQKQRIVDADLGNLSVGLRNAPGMPGAAPGPVPGAVAPPGLIAPGAVGTPGANPRLLGPPPPPELMPARSVGMREAPVSPALGRVVSLKAQQNKALFESMADQIAQANGIKPEVLTLFKTSVMPQESAYDPNAVSPAGAQGLVQLMPATQKELGVTNPFDPAQNIRGGLVYLQKQWDAFGGDPAKALAAYNAGPGAVQKYGAVPPYPETQKYVQRGTAAYQQAQAGTPAPAGAVAPPSAAPVAPVAPEVAQLQQRRALLQAQLQYQTEVLRPQRRTTEGLAQIDKTINDTRAELTRTDTALNQARVAQGEQARTDIARQTLDIHKAADVRAQQKELREQRKEAEVPFDKDFEAYFATHHNSQRPKDAMKAPGGPEVVQKALADFEQHKAERDALAAALKEEATLPAAIKRAEAGKAATPIPDVTAKSLVANTAIYNSINKIETILSEGGDLPPDFVNAVSEGRANIQKYLQGDPKGLTGFIQQYKTRYGAAFDNDPRVNRFISALANMRDLVIQERSGAAVSANELQRAVGAFGGSLPDLGQAFSLFAENLGNVKQRAFDELVLRGASVRPLSGGKVVEGGLPDAVRLQIRRNEARAETPPVEPPPAAPIPDRPASAAPAAPARTPSGPTFGTPAPVPAQSAPQGEVYGPPAPAAEISDLERQLRKKYGIP